MSEKEDPLEKSRMTLGEHLDELRSRLIKATLALLIVFVGTWVFRQEIAAIVLRPLEQTVTWLNEDLVEINQQRLEDDPELERSDLRKPISSMPRGDAAGSGFFFYIKCCFYFSLFIGGPFVLWQLWQFIAAGLYQQEQRMVRRLFPFSLLLFFSGVTFGYFMLVPYGQYFLVRMGLEQVEYYPEIGVYFAFLTSLSLALGAVFQLPILMLALARLELVGPGFYSKYRGHFIVISLLTAAMLTPPDPYTQMLMAIPMVILYELGNVLARLSLRRSRAGRSTDKADPGES